MLKDMELKMDRDDAGLSIRRNILVEDFVEEYLKYSQVSKSGSTYSRDSLTLNKHFALFFKDRFLQEVDHRAVEQYILERASKVAHSTVNRELVTIHHMFSKALEWRYVKENPCKGRKKLREEERAPQFLSKPEIDALLASADTLLFPIVYMALATGCRQGELLNLQWEDVDLNKKQIIIQKKKDWRTKSGRYRAIPINDEAANLLLKLKSRSTSQYVFSRPDDSKLGKGIVRKRYVKAVRSAGIKSTDFKILRHTYASHLVMGGVDIRTVQQLLGHHSVKTTEKYSHLAPDYLQSVTGRIDFLRNMDSYGPKMVTTVRRGRESSLESES